MTRKRIGRHVGGGQEPRDEREAREGRDRLRDAFASWTTGVAIVAVRDGATVHALTVSAFLPVSVDPPRVVVSLGPNASARPFLRPGARYAISILGAGQRGIASRFADTFPVGPTPFEPAGPPVVRGALTAFECVVESLIPGGDHELVMGSVESVRGAVGAEGHDAGAALAYFRRAYHAIG